MSAKQSLTNTALAARGASKQLVIIIHGLKGGASRMAAVRASVEIKLPDADIMMPSYSSHMLTNANPIEIAKSLEYLISDAVRDRADRPDKLQYEKIYLIGFSVGGLILREVYLYARGLTETFHRADLLKAALVPRAWTQIPVRIILLAGMNRGWRISPKPPKMKWNTWLGFLLALGFARATRSGLLIRSAQNGAPFVANLRVRWKLLQLSEDKSVPRPEVYQLLGTVDDLVSEEDQTDLFLSEDFVFIPVVETNHEQIVQFDNTDFGLRRREIFEDIISRERDELWKLYRREHERVLAKQNTKPEDHVVFLMHGIRDFGRWTQLMADSFRRNHPDIAVRTAKYRYFPMGAFLLFNARQKHVRWFMDLYTEEIAKNPSVKVSFVGHSNGTYILASAMEHYSSIEINNVVFAGSVVPRRCQWSRWQREGRVQAVQNYMAANDWVVALFPRLFELIAEITPFKHFGDIGSAGFTGFEDPLGQRFERVVKGSHSGALKVCNHDRIASFIADQKDEPFPDLLTDEVSKRLMVASKLCWLIWAFLVFAVALIGFLFATELNKVAPLSVGVWAIIYAFLVWLLLETV